MNRSFLISVLAIAIAIIALGCSTNGKHQEKVRSIVIDTDSITINDTTILTSLSGVPQIIKVRGYYQYPKSSPADGNSSKLIGLYSDNILEMQDSLNITEKLVQYTKDVQELVKNRFSESTASEQSEDSKLQQINIRITELYNGNNMLCFCKDIFYTTQNNNTIVSKSYYNFDVLNNKPIQFEEIFQGTKTDQLCDLIKDKLTEKEHVSNVNELIDMGYFNIENLKINKFYITEDGVVFVFDPYDIACYALGEISVKLPFAEIEPFLMENSILSNLI